MNYYNEYDLKAAAWLRELINQGLIPAGDVDTRSIVDVRPADLTPYTQCHFFAGIGGWSYALQLAGVPATTPLWTGSCPCQPFSAAGKGLAQADERHLWPVFFDLIRQCRPQHVFGEQVASAIGHGWLDGISADLEAEDYACGATVLGAHSVSAPHQRQRLYWVANASSRERDERGSAHSQSGAVSKLVRCSEADGLANAESGRAWDDESICIRGTTAESVAHSEAGRLDDTRRPSDERRGELGDVGRSAGEEQSEARERQRGGHAGSDPVQDDCGGVFPNSDGCSAGSPATTTAGYGNTIEPAGGRLDRLAYTDEKRWGELRRYQGQKQPDADKQPADGCSIWSDFSLVHCRDGKTRRIPTEPAFFPLAHGVPARVVRLRGYGNAIVPQVAAEFIQAFYETQQPPHADWI